ncbi:hypothetical protein ES703_84286 [subsurface metagenome]
MCIQSWIGLVGGSIAILGLIVWVVRRMYRWLWPSIGDWIGYLSESKDELRGEEATRWKFNGRQQIGQSFTLDIRKHKGKGRGKARLIRQVKFSQGINHQWDCPSEYKMIIEGGSAILGEFVGRAGEPWKGERYKGISEEFEPLLAEYITVVITKASEHSQAECWATNDVNITEIRIRWLPNWRLFRRIREWVIE